MASFELAGGSKDAESFVAQADNTRRNLVIDYFFIVAYVATLASGSPNIGTPTTSK